MVEEVSLSRFTGYGMGCLPCKEAPHMAGGRCMAGQARPPAFLDGTSGTRDACQRLVPPLEAACHAPLRAWRLDGPPRTARRLRVDQHCPLPTPAARLGCLLPYLQTSALLGGQGCLCGG